MTMSPILRRRTESAPVAAVVIFATLLLSQVVFATESEPAETDALDRTMAITVDDLPAQRISGLLTERIERLTAQMTGLFEEQAIPAIAFVNEQKLQTEDGNVDPARVALLEQWLDAGVELGNHTYSHPNLHRMELADFERDVLRGERVLRPLLAARGEKTPGYAVPRYFRHPFLRTGRDLATRDGLHAFLAEHGYRVAPVTIDNSEWIFARAYDEALDRGDDALATRLGTAYVAYMLDMVRFYEGQSVALFERNVAHTLLIHANALNGDWLDELVAGLREMGYRFVDLDTALDDPAYESADTYTGPAGISWLHRWALTRDVDRAMFGGEPATPGWVQELAGIEE